jgi:hypothetical protein
MLINQQNRDILPLRREAIECRFNLRGFGFGVHDQEVLLRVGGWGYVLGTLDLVPVEDESEEVESQERGK